MYSVKEIYYTLQGEGAQSGRPAIFVRFSGCNLWSGLERDRVGAVCSFCDTDFVGTDGVNGGQFPTAEELASCALKVARAALKSDPFTEMGKQGSSIMKPPPLPLMAVFTGGEPTLQVDEPLIAAFQQRGFFTAIETNGTRPAPQGIDWICVSPKIGSKLVQRCGNEIKVVFGQEGLDLTAFVELDFDHFYLQPMDCKDIDLLTKDAIAYCKAHPQWKLSVQSHKFLDIP